jgi:hypothetical protein
MKTIPSIIILVLLATASYAQKTPEELGEIAFYCFKNSQLDSLHKHKATMGKLLVFAYRLGLDNK